MALVLGIHVGHDVACALVRDGELVSAVQLERISRIKHHATESLSDVLPISEVLGVVGATIDDVDRIVSSYQAASVGGFGLDRPLITPSFSLFDPFAPRHHTISHHLAHAHCAVAYAPDTEVAVLISDLAGSATGDGGDFSMPFADWYETLTSSPEPVSLRSECLSMYRSRPGQALELLHREHRIPHNGPESHVCSVGSLYDNVTQAVFRRPHSHGSLMAMAAFGRLDGSERPMVDIEGERVVFRNDWQHEVFADAVPVSGVDRFALPFEATTALARRCQEAAEAVLLAYARRISRLSGAHHLALGGGTFLNILANTKLAQCGLFESVSLPSAPHDAGIAVGCAFHGAAALGDTRVRVVRDRLGPVYPRTRIEAAIEAAGPFVTATPTDPGEVARRLQGGQIFARSAGRSEFGPRALGARSLLGSPLLAQNKDRLNQIKGRQPWRPVAPIVASEHMQPAFDGPPHSPWMTFSHQLSPDHAERLAALRHPDASTRAQSLTRAQDPWLHDLLIAFGERTGYAVLINTSLNGPAQPILETPEQAITWFLENDDVDTLLLDDLLIERRSLAEVIGDRALRPSAETFVLRGPPDRTDPTAGPSIVVRLGTASLKVRSAALKTIFARNEAATLDELRARDEAVDEREIWSLLVRGILEACPGGHG